MSVEITKSFSGGEEHARELNGIEPEIAEIVARTVIGDDDRYESTEAQVAGAIAGGIGEIDRGINEDPEADPLTHRYREVAKKTIFLAVTAGMSYGAVKGLIAAARHHKEKKEQPKEKL